MCSVPSKCAHDYWIWSRGPDYSGKAKHSSDKFPTAGKWLVYADAKRVNDTWDKIKKATRQGKLGISSKVSTMLGASLRKEKHHIICVYTHDFSDKKDVARVKDALRKMGFKRLSYKTDLQTMIESIASEMRAKTKLKTPGRKRML